MFLFRSIPRVSALQVVMRKILQHSGFDVTICENGQLAVDAWLRTRASTTVLIISQLSLPSRPKKCFFFFLQAS